MEIKNYNILYKQPREVRFMFQLTYTSNEVA